MTAKLNRTLAILKAPERHLDDEEILFVGSRVGICVGISVGLGVAAGFNVVTPN